MRFLFGDRKRRSTILRGIAALYLFLVVLALFDARLLFALAVVSAVFGVYMMMLIRFDAREIDERFKPRK